MKKYSKLIAFLTALVLCLSPLFQSVLTVHAEGPVTYYLKYVTEKNEWRYQTGSAWTNGAADGDVKALQTNIKDGDLLVIDGEKDILLTVNVHLSNLTIVHSPCAVIAANSIDTFYAINDSVSAVNGNVKTAYVYDGCIVNFNNNVSYLELASEKNVNLFATIAVVGTVDHVQANGKDFTHFEFYNFAENSMRIEAGHLKTPADKYSKTPQAAATPTTPSVPAAPSTSAGNEYDDVPKTGDTAFLPIWLIGIAVLCLVGSRKIKHIS